MEEAFSGLGNGTKFDNKVLQTSHSTVGHLSTKLRLVRCPKCRQLLQESANVPVYKCGGCYTVLRGRNKGRKKSRKAKVETGFPSPPSSKSIVLHRRPGYGQMGSKCLVKANHFLAEISKRDLTQYSVTIEPEVGSTKLNIAIMTQLVKLHRDTDLGKRLPVYDGRKAFYTAGVLPFTSKEFTIQLAEEDEGLGIIREREFKVTIKFAARAGMHQLHELISGKQIDTSLEARKIIAIVLKQLACQRYVSVGRFFYSSNIKRPQLLGNGLQSWRGFYQSLKPTQMGLSLNIDMSATAFIEPLPVIEFVAQVLGKDVYSRPLSDADCVKVKKALRGVKFEVTHRGNMRRKYRISGLTSLPTSELIFPVDEEKNMKSVIDYFQEVYGFTIRHSHLPCLLVGSARKVNYLPMEACKIVEGQRYSKRLNDKQITSLLKLSCQRPKEQEAEILQSAIGLLYGGHILCLSETKIVRKTLKGKCRSMSVLSLEDHIQHVDRRWEDAAKSHGAKRICRQLVIHRLSTAKHIRKQHGIHRWPFQRFAIGLPDGGHILPLLEKKIVRKTLKRKCRSMRVLSLVGCQQHVDRRWEDAAKYIGAKHICRQLKIPRVSIAKRICRQHGIHHRWPFERDWATEKGYSLGDEILVEVISLSTHAELVWRLQLIYISWLGRFSPRPSALPRGGLIAGPIALSSSVAATNNITQCVRQDQIGSGASGSENERTSEQKDPKEKRKSITIDDLLVFQGKKTREEVAEILCVSLSTVKRTWTTSGHGTWKNGGRKKVLRPPDQHGERNTSTARETPSHNVQTGIEGVPVGQNQEANEFRPDFTEGSIPSNTENGLIIGSSFGFPPPQITSMPSEYMGGSIDLRNSLANLTFATCSDQAAPSQHVQVSKPPDQHGERNTSTACEAPPHNVQTGIEGESVGHSPACFTVQTLSPRPSARRTPAPTAEPSIPLEDRQQEENEASFVDTTSITYSNLSHLCEGENIVQTDDILGGQGSAALWDYTIDFGMGEQNREVETREQPSPQRSPAADRGKGPANNEMEMPIRLFPLANLVEEVCHPLLNTIARAHPETFAHFNPRTPLLGSMLLRNLHDLLVPWARLRFDEFTLAKETAMQELSQDLVSLGFDLGWLSARGSALRAAKERVALQPEIQSLSALVESTRESLANLEARLAQAKRQDAELAAAALNLADLGPSELVFEELAS